jgi:hypothetical protein
MVVVVTRNLVLEATDESSTTEELAIQRWGALKQLDASNPMRAELAAAGVPAATIASLYPFAFADCVQGLLPLITVDRLDSLSSMDSLTQLVNKLVTLRWLLPEDISALVVEPPTEEEFQASLAPLAAHLFNVLEESVSHPLARHTMARTASVLLNHASILMEHRDRTDYGTHEAVCVYFLLVVEVIVPGLAAEVVA